MKTIILIDGKNMAYRQFYTRKGLVTDYGENTGAIYGILSGLLSIAKRFPDSKIVFIWDGVGPTWRHKLLDSYKINRSDVIPPDRQHEIITLHKQIAILKTFFRKMEIRQCEVACLEGDDLLGIVTTALIKKHKVIIHSTDKDFYQFIPCGVKIMKGLDGEGVKYANPKEIEQQYGVPLSSWNAYKAFVGDSSDCIPKIYRGLGPKAAAGFVLAGLDASMERWTDLPRRVRLVHRQIKKGKLTWSFKKDWEKIHLNFRLCQIIRTADAEQLRPTLQKNAASALKGLVSDLKHTVKRNHSQWRYMTRFCAEYQLADIMGRRQQLWNLK